MTKVEYPSNHKNVEKIEQINEALGALYDEYGRLSMPEALELNDELIQLSGGHFKG